jgi:hypothetical protein
MWQQKNVTFRRSLAGLSALLRHAIAVICSLGFLQPSDIRRYGNGASQLSPLRSVLGNSDPLIELIRICPYPYVFSNAPQAENELKCYVYVSVNNFVYLICENSSKIDLLYN